MAPRRTPNYQVNDQWRLSVRAEYFDDKDGYRTGVIQKWKEATLTLAYLPTKFIELRGEVRVTSRTPTPLSKTLASSAGVRRRHHRQSDSIGLEAVYKF